MALQQGTIDAQENPFEVIYANRLYEQQDYVILTNHLPASHNLLISQVVYNGLSDTDKELIMAVGKAAIQYSREQCDARLSEAVWTWWLRPEPRSWNSPPTFWSSCGTSAPVSMTRSAPPTAMSWMTCRSAPLRNTPERNV